MESEYIVFDQISDIVGWLGFLLSAGLGIHTIHTRRKDDRISFSCIAFRRRKQSGPLREYVDNIEVEIGNIGKRATTIRDVMFVACLNEVEVFRGDVEKTIQNGTDKLEPGAIWQGYLVPSEGFGQPGYVDHLLLRIFHPHSDTPTEIKTQIFNDPPFMRIIPVK